MAFEKTQMYINNLPEMNIISFIGNPFCPIQIEECEEKKNIERE